MKEQVSNIAQFTKSVVAVGLRSRHFAFIRLRYLVAYTIVFIGIFSNSAAGQFAVTKEYTEKELGANNFTAIFQDSKGKIWIPSYNGGVNCFDGEKTVYFNHKTGLYNSGVDLLFEDREGGIWMRGRNGIERWFQGKSTLLLNGEDYSSKAELFFDRVEKVVQLIRLPSTQVFQFDSKSNSFLSTGKYIFTNGVKHNESVSIVVNRTLNKKAYLTLIDRSTWTTRFYENTDSSVASSQQLREKRILADSKITLGDEVNSTAISWLDAFNREYFIGIDSNRIFAIYEDKVVPFEMPRLKRYGREDGIPLGKLITNSYNYQRNVLICIWSVPGLANKYSYLLAEMDLHSQKWREVLLFDQPEDTPKGVMKDNAGTYWISGFTKVLRIYPWLMTVKSTAPGYLNETWSIGQAGNGRLWMGSYGSGLASFDGVDIGRQPIGLPSTTKYDDMCYKDSKGNLYFNVEQDGTPRGPGILQFDGSNRWKLISKGNIGFFFGEDNYGNLMRGMNYKGLWILPRGKDIDDENSWLKFDKDKGFELTNVLTAVQDKYDRYWVGRPSAGLAMYDPRMGRFINWKRVDHPNGFGVMCSATDYKGNLWFGTDKGLAFFENRRDINASFEINKYVRFVSEDLIASSLVTVCKIFRDSFLLVGNQIGAFVLDIRSFYENDKQVTIYPFTAIQGSAVGAIYQNSGWIDDDQAVWMVGAKGLLRINPLKCPKYTSIFDFYLDSIRIGNKVHTDYSKPFSLESGSNQPITFHYRCSIDPLMMDRTVYEFRKSEQDQWQNAGRSYSFIPSLEETGIHTIYLRARRDGITSKEIIIKFKKVEWWQNPLVWLSIIAVIVISGFYYRKRSKDKQNERLAIAQQKLEFANQKLALVQLGKEKNKLQVQAIVNQLNPHFINNALQWLQVRVDEDEEAVKVVGKLSENISTVFKNSRNKKPYHSLKDELKLTENYLYIQKKRFGRRLDYQIPNEEVLASVGGINVPLMIIQIHSENAVEHGVRNNQVGIGKVTIRISEDEQYVYVYVEDDGVGRAAARVIGSRGTQNGTKMLLELESIYNEQNSLKISQTYDDLPFVNAEGKPCGTRVTIVIPKVYQFEL